MAEEYSADLITLIDEEGESHEFQILDAIETEDGRFVALLPNFEEEGIDPEEDGTYYIFEVKVENGEEELLEIDDEKLLDQLAEIFESRFDEMYGEVEEV